MTDKQINKQLIKDVETAVNNVANAYNGAFKIKKSDEGTDRVSNFTLRLTSSEWNKDAQIKFSIDRPSEYVGDADDPTYYAACEMGMRVNFYDGFVGTKHSIDIMGRPNKEKVGKFVETLFLPTSIEILKFAKAKRAEIKKKLPGAEWTKFKMRLREFYRDMWKGTIKKVPTEEQISQLFFESKTNESISKTPKQISENMLKFSTSIAINDFIESSMPKSMAKGNFVVLSLGKRSQLNNIKQAVEQAAGKDFLEPKDGELSYFIFFKHVSKEDIKKAITEMHIFGGCSDNDIVEITIKERQYFIVKITFTID